MQSSIYITWALFGRYRDCLDLRSVSKKRSLIAVSSWSLRSVLANGILIWMANSRNSAAYQYPLSNARKVIVRDNLRFLAGPFGLGAPAIVNHIRSVRGRMTGHPE